jgi:hypothetical protein
LDVERAMPSVYEIHLRCLALREPKSEARPRRSGRTRRAEAIQAASAERSARLKEILQEVRAERRKWAS